MHACVCVCVGEREGGSVRCVWRVNARGKKAKEVTVVVTAINVHHRLQFGCEIKQQLLKIQQSSPKVNVNFGPGGNHLACASRPRSGS